MEDLPENLTIGILSRLPIKTIICCRLVCRKWRNFVSDSFFVNLHLSGSPTTGFIVHKNVLDPGILTWVEIEDKVDHHRLHYDSLMSLDLVPIFQNSGISLKGSVNGLICLWHHNRHYSPEHDNTYICNPVTREILNLPIAQYHKHCFPMIAYGFGVSSLTGEYKVVRTFERKIPLMNGNKSREYKLVPEAEVYTLGTGQWRSLGRLPYWLYGSDVGAVLNDHFHWVVSDYEDAPERICTFDLNKETFQLFPSPPFEEEEEIDNLSLAVLKGCLCISNYGNDSQFTIWVMKEYGIKKSWHKEVVITKEALNRSQGWLYWYTVSLIEGLKDGTIFFMSGRTVWAFYPRSDTVEKIDTFWCLKSGLAYRPSLLRLQDFESERVQMF